MGDVRLEFFSLAEKFLFFFFELIDGLGELFLFIHGLLVELGLFGFELEDLLIEFCLLDGGDGFDFF